MIKKICIYCSSSAKTPQRYVDSAKELIRILHQNEYGLVYGGGSVGLMGAVADEMIALGGEVMGIIPEFMKAVEWDHPNVENMITVNSMHVRKLRLIEESDVLLALPGGCGTLEELLEAITLKRLAIFNKPIIIYNQDGFYNGLLQQFDRCVTDQCIGTLHKELWTVITHPSQIIAAIDNAHSFVDYDIHQASV